MPIATERLRVVLDTNALVSGLNYAGTPSRLLRLLFQVDIDLYVSPFILQELHRILTEKFRWEAERVQGALRIIIPIRPDDAINYMQEGRFVGAHGRAPLQNTA